MNYRECITYLGVTFQVPENIVRIEIDIIHMAGKFAMTSLM